MKLLYLETPTNPTLKVLDIERLAAAGHAAGATIVVDNTFATPINQNPLALGADLVVHSTTRFLGGHAAALGGVIVGEAALMRTEIEVVGCADARTSHCTILASMLRIKR